EVFRRHLEAAATDVATIGFAGFFGFAVEYLPLAHDRGETQCPVLLTPAFSVAESVGDAERQAEAVEDRRLRHHVRRAWKSFKMGAVSCFSFVGPVGLVYLPKMFTDAYGRTRPVARPEDEALPRWAIDAKGPTLEPTPAPDGGDAGAGIPLEARVQLATGALTAMSLTEGFAPIVAIVGHGASTTNNPYDTGLDCGACGGHTGEANARVAAAILNDPQVRAALADNGIEVPADTRFVAAQHNTTTDEITVFDRGAIPASHLDALASLEASFEVAGRGARAERARRMGIDPASDVDAAVLRRSADWAQVRPEWGLAGCRAFVVAPRGRTKDLDLGGRAFLHSYEWRKDEGFGVLELVMTAPMVVASWISLQYYASTVENRLFGSGNKVLHNVVGKLGVLEGNGGDLRVGLPWQSVHDGEEYQHEPLRLNVVIEAPIDAMNDVLANHAGVKDLVDNGWLQLLALDDGGRISHRYAGDLNWEPVG
ncbi:MAG: putative inorganic carbon transporter subunit DabA, partial [Microthrixaceae bacterium]